jgi:hypothetical protein
VDRPIGDDRPGPVAAHDVAVVGKASVDGADRVGIDPQRGPQLAYRREPHAGLEPAGLDLVGELPVDLRRDRDIRVALDVQVALAGEREGIQITH